MFDTSTITIRQFNVQFGPAVKAPGKIQTDGADDGTVVVVVGARVVVVVAREVVDATGAVVGTTRPVVVVASTRGTGWGGGGSEVVWSVGAGAAVEVVVPRASAPSEPSSCDRTDVSDAAPEVHAPDRALARRTLAAQRAALISDRTVLEKDLAHMTFDSTSFTITFRYCPFCPPQ